MVAAFEWPDLWPSSVGELRGEQVADAAEKAGAVGFALGAGRCCGDEREEAELGRGGVVVERADVVPVRVAWGVEVVGAEVLGDVVGGVGLSALAGSGAHVEVLAPSACGRLEADDDVGCVAGFGGSVPVGAAVERHAAGAEALFGDGGFGGAGGALGGEGGLISETLLFGALEVGGPGGAIFFRELRDALGGDRFGGFAGADDCGLEGGKGDQA